ncbi:unnamed protein product [Effrenium voratum]|nr:unnamed protein product [Effrenium voratum]
MARANARRGGRGGSRKAPEAESTEAPAVQMPYGANFQRQDLRRRKNTSASKGGKQSSKKLNQMYGKDGRLKRKYSNGPEEITGAPVTRRQDRQQRHQHQQIAALSRSSLLKIKTKNEPMSFSSAMTPELLATLQEGDEVADARPPDLEAGDEQEPTTGLAEVLQKVFGHESFRPGQQEAMESVLNKQKTLLLLATGSGKSLCYQLPAYLRGAVCSGQQSRDQVREVMRAVRARMVDVLFVSPERLAMWSFDGCGLPPIALACIDEAHCVSEWSHNFRPDYLRLSEYLQGALQARRLLALTATATKPTVQSVCDILQLERVVRSDRSFSVPELLAEKAQIRVQRANLAMDIRNVPDVDLQLREIIKVLRTEVNPTDSIIIYVWRRVTADQLAKQLRPYVKGGISAYHGSMLPEARSAVQANFMGGKIRVVVATVAFGMGLDKPDIRMVLHYGLPKSIENYIQETGRCARDGLPGKCIALVCPKDYQAMRWLESGGHGGGTKSSVVRTLLRALLGNSDTYPRHALSKEALVVAGGRPEDFEEGGFQPYCVALDEKLASRELNASTDELHSVLAHLSRYAVGSVSVLSNFPTKLKLRFFKSDPQELIAIDPLLRQVLPLAKKVGPVYTLDTAKAVAVMGGTAGQLSTGLWQARGDEFSVEKAEYGYMVAVLRSVSEAEVDDWAEQISSINVRARASAVEKLDACFLALTRSAEARERQKVAEPDATESAADVTMNGLIDAYFSATEEPSAVVSGGTEERRRRLSAALGAEYHLASQARPLAQRPSAAFPSARGSGGAASSAAAPSERQRVTEGLVRATVARLLMDPDWPELPCSELDALVTCVAQFLAGVGSVVLPTLKWREHRFWGHFRNFGDFQHLEEHVHAAVEKCLPMVQKHKRQKTA